MFCCRLLDLISRNEESALELFTLLLDIAHPKPKDKGIQYQACYVTDNDVKQNHGHTVIHSRMHCQ